MSSRLDLTPMEKEQLAIMARRKAEEERRKRILDPKIRTLGVDVSGLEKQIQEKKAIESMEKERQRLYDEYSLQVEKQVLYLEKEQAKAKRAEAASLNQFRSARQGKETRREYDLNDSDSLKRELPARIGDDDPRLGPASLQRFDGEDLSATARHRAQQMQMRNWVAQQMEEKEMTKEQEKELDRLYEARMEEIDGIAQILDQELERRRKEQETKTKEFNKTRARVTDEMKREQREKEQEKNMEEIRNLLDSDLLNERLDTTVSAADPSRFKPYHMKGFLPEQRKAILDTQEQQRQELERKRQEEAEEERRWAREQARQLRTATAMERDTLRQRRQMSADLKRENIGQAHEFKEKTKQIQDMYTNRVTEDFFSQFGTSSR